MATVGNVIQELNFDCLEDAGFTLGIITTQTAIDLLNLTILDFLKSTGIVKVIFTQSVLAGVRQYLYPSSIMMLVEDVFVSGRYLEPSTVTQIFNYSRNWRRDLAVPTAWHEDNLPLSTIELAPGPNYTGASIDNLAPSVPPPDGQIGEFSAVIDGTVYPAYIHRGLTIVGTEKPVLVSDLSDPIPLIPDEFALGYLPFGVLERICQSDSELKNPAMADWYGSNYREGIEIAKSISWTLGPEQ